MKPHEKRTSTEPGLGKVAGDARKTSVRERLGRTSISSSPPDGGEERVDGRAPTDRPPSGPPISAPSRTPAPLSARHTRALERPVIARDDEEVDTSPSREEMPFDRLDQLERMERTRQDRVETPRSPGVTGKPPAPVPSRPAPSRPAPARSTSSLPPVSHRSQRPIEGRPVRTSTKPPASGGRGRPSQRAPRASLAPPAASSPPPATLRPRSQRTSIRVDDLGDGVGQVTAAVDVAARQVPRLLKSKDEIAAAPIDHRAGFLLAHIDGTMSVQGLVDIASMPEQEVHEILERLRRLGIVALR